VKIVPASPTQPASHFAKVYLPQRAKQSQILTGDPKQVAQQLVEKLKFEARVI
jgi:electron transfer flavoprotein beta subunit